MKTTTLLLALLFLSALTGRAQQAKGGEAMVEAQAAAKKEEKKAAVVPPKPTSEILGKKVIYGGYLTDLKRSEGKRSFFSLRSPIDPQKDVENLWFYPGTDKVQGVVFFSIKF
ncbi:MAG: hypothetical protein U1G07_14260 [Verrucomicrobiota bacterium]